MRRTRPPTRHDAPTESLVGLTLAAGRQGLWLAVADCRLDEETWRPVSGRVLDSDADFGALNQRLALAGVSSVAVVFVEPQPRTTGLKPPPPPADLLALVPTLEPPAKSAARDVADGPGVGESYVRSLTTGKPVALGRH